MSQRYDSYWRLEPNPSQHSFAAGFAACVHDPLWFLARQWQMGEHQGENASTPVLVTFESVGTSLEPAAATPELDPRVVPPEVIIEGEPEEWWTMGRRVRLGAKMAQRLGLSREASAATPYLLLDPPPPYEALKGEFDGLALWRARGILDGDGASFAAFDIPPARSSYWRSDELLYACDFPLANFEGNALRVPRHRGGRVDWFTADAEHAADGAAFVPEGDGTLNQAYPGALNYPGSPATRWWEIEDAAVDIGGYPPDSSHFATALLIDLIGSHCTDWFLFPVDAQAGQIVTLVAGSVVVKDGFGDSYDLAPPSDGWSLFRTSGLDEDSLVVWLRAITPLQGPSLEQVLIGPDEYSNMLWAVEMRVDLRDLAPPQRTEEEERDNPTRGASAASSEHQKSYMFVPGQDAAAHWHPYELVDEPASGGGLSRKFVQRRLADLAREQPELLPPATGEVLRVSTPSGEAVHEIDPATIPSIGLTIERRSLLARDVLANPRLWIRRQRMPFLAPPSRQMRFDVMVEDNAAE